MNKRFLLIWLVLIAVSTLVIVHQSDGISVNSDIRAMLPDSMADPLGLVARQQLETKLEGLNFIAVGHENKATAIQAAKAFSNKVEQTEAFDKVVLQRLDQGAKISKSLYPYRFSRLSPQQKQALSDGDYASLIAKAQSQLWSPASLVTSSTIIEDPFFLFLEQLDGFASLSLSNDNGYLLTQSAGKYWVLIELLVSKNVFSPSQQGKLISAIDNSSKSLEREFEGASLLKAGLLFHANAATQQARFEMSTIGGSSMLVICLIILMFFRSIKPLTLACLSLLGGLLLALAMVSLFFEQLHLLTLVFGASLIGIAIDYSFHFSAEHAGKQVSALTTLKRISPALGLSACSSVLAYLSMLFVNMQGIQQMAVFCAAGLFGAALSLYLLAPVICAQMPKARWSRNVTQLSVKAWFWVALVALIASGLLQLRAENDLRQLRGSFPEVERQQKQLMEMYQNGQANQFFLVRGQSAEQVLQTEQRLLERLSTVIEQKGLGKAWGLSEIIPTVDEQLHNWRLVQQFYQQLPSLFEQMGYSEALVEKAQGKFEVSDAMVLTPELFLAAPANHVFKDFWLSDGKQQASIVSLFDVQNLSQLEELAQTIEGVEFVDPVAEISLSLNVLRSQASTLLLVVLVVISTLLLIRLPKLKALRCLATPTLAVLFALSTVGWLGQGVSLFHILALLLVFGVGLDYSLFYQLSTKPSYRIVMATSLAACSTLLAFGLLALSTTPALSGFGVVVLSGIACSYLLAPLFVESAKESER